MNAPFQPYQGGPTLARPDMVEWLYQALASPRGIILETEQPKAVLSLLLEAKATSHEFLPIRILPLEDRGQVWLIKDCP